MARKRKRNKDGSPSPDPIAVKAKQDPTVKPPPPVAVEQPRQPKPSGVGSGFASLMSSIFGSYSKPPEAQASLFDANQTKDIENAIQERKLDNQTKLKKQQQQPANVGIKFKEGGGKKLLSTKQILRTREEQADHPLLESNLEFPSAFGQDNEDDEDSDSQGDDDGSAILQRDPFAEIALPKDEQTREISAAVQDSGFCVLRGVLNRQLLQTKVVPKVDALEQKLYGALDARKIPWRIPTGTQPSTHDANANGELPNSKKKRKKQRKQKNVTKEPKQFRFQEAASRCKGRMDMVVPEDSIFHSHEIIQNKMIYPIICNLFGLPPPKDGPAPIQNFDEHVKLVYAGIILNLPGSDDQPWHQDGHPLFPELEGALHGQLPCYALNVFIPLETADGATESGPTELIPGSHTSTELPSDNSDVGETSSNDKPAGPILKQGDALIYDYRVCHRGTKNLSQRTRRILYLMYARPWFTDHVNFAYDKTSQALFAKHKTRTSLRKQSLGPSQAVIENKTGN